MLVTILAICFMILGIITLTLTAFGAFLSYLIYWWDKRATQGTIILTTMGMSLMIFGSVVLF